MLSRDILFEESYFPYHVSNLFTSSSQENHYDEHDHTSQDFFQLPLAHIHIHMGPLLIQHSHTTLHEFSAEFLLNARSTTFITWAVTLAPFLFLFIRWASSILRPICCLPNYTPIFLLWAYTKYPSSNNIALQGLFLQIPQQIPSPRI